MNKKPEPESVDLIVVVQKGTMKFVAARECYY